MWTTIVLLGLAVSIEPARVGLIAFLLTKQHPLRHLLTYMATGFTISFSVGVLVLFVFHRGLPGPANGFNPALIQIGIGVVALLLAALLASNIPLGKFTTRTAAEAEAVDPDLDDVDSEQLPPTGVKRLTAKARHFVKGESRWFSGSVGAALAMPSFDYFALLALIIASRKSPLEQLVGLVTFLTLASLAALVPMVGFLVAPARTREIVARFNIWIRTRTRRHAGAFVAVLGIVLIGVGLHSL